MIAGALESRLDLIEFCLKGQKIEASWFWLPPLSTPGNPNAGIVIEVAAETAPIPAIVVAGLKALARWDKNGRSWFYERSEQDYSVASVFLDRLERLVLEKISHEAERDTAIIARALHTQCLILGANTRGQPENPNLKELFAPVPDESTYDDPRVASNMSQTLTLRRKAIAGRAELQDRMKHLIGCYQGSSGQRILAIDADRLKRAWKMPLAQRWVLGLKAGGILSEEGSDALERLTGDSLTALITKLKAAVQLFLPQIKDAFENDYSRVEWRDTLKALVQESIELVMLPNGFEEAEVIKIVDRLSQDDIVQRIRQLRQMHVASSDESELDQLSNICIVPLPRFSQLACDVIDLTRFLNDLAKKIEAQTRNAESETALAKRDELINSLIWN